MEIQLLARCVGYPHLFAEAGGLAGQCQTRVEGICLIRHSCKESSKILVTANRRFWGTVLSDVWESGPITNFGDHVGEECCAVGRPSVVMMAWHATYELHQIGR